MALEGVVIWAIFNGLGKHTNELKPYEFEIQLKVCFSNDMFLGRQSSFGRL